MDLVALGHQLGVGPAHALDDGVDQPGEEALGGREGLPAVADGAAKDAAQNVFAPLVARARAVGDRKRQRADVVCDDAVGHVDAVGVLGADPVAVGLQGATTRGGRARGRRSSRSRSNSRGIPFVALGQRGLADGLEDRRKDVGRVVGHPPLQHARQPLHPGARVDVARRERLQAPVVLAVELDEHQVPHLEHVWVVGVDEGAGVAPPSDPVVVDLGAGAAGALVSHLPEVVLAPKGQHPGLGQKPEPDSSGLLVGRQPLGLVAAKVRRVQPLRVQGEDLRQELPRPLDRLLLEVVPEGPVAQHLEEGVVVDVPPDVVEVVVLAAGADALLRVGRAGQLGEVGVGVGGPQENRLELVHPRVGEE